MHDVQVSRIGLIGTVLSAAFLEESGQCLAVRQNEDSGLTEIFEPGAAGSDTVFWDGAVTTEPRLSVLSDNRLLCLFPGEALVVIPPGPTLNCREIIKFGARGCPMLIAETESGLLALYDGADGPRLFNATLEGNLSNADEIALPNLAWDSCVSALFEVAGNLILCADNLRTGFEAWMRTPDGIWSQSGQTGANRFAMNAAVTAATRIGPSVWIGAGAGWRARANLMGMPTRADLFKLEGTGHLTLIAGEQRVGQGELITPLVGLDTAFKSMVGEITQIVSMETAVLVALHRPDDLTSLYTVSSELEIAETTLVDGKVLNMHFNGETLRVAFRYSDRFPLLEES